MVALADIFEQVKLAGRAKDPATACADGRLEKLLDRWTRVLGDATGKPDRTLPVRFDQVRYAEYDPHDRHGGMVNNNLVLLKRGNINHAQSSIILADETVDVSDASNCIIIARIAARVSNSDNCLIVSGCMLEASIDRGSILLCAEEADFHIIENSICAVGGRLQIGIPQRVAAVNSPIADRGGMREGNRTVQIPELRLKGPDAKNLLADRITITSSFRDRDGVALFRLANGKGEYVARYGQKVNDPDE